MWLFRRRKDVRPEIKANSVEVVDGIVRIDVRGQTCPGYLLAINKAVDTLQRGTPAELIITYPPCGEDVHTWCKARDIQYQGISREDGNWKIRIRK